RQDDQAPGAFLHRGLYRRVAGDRAVGEIMIPVADRRERARDRGGCDDRLRRGTFRQHHAVAGDDVGGDDMHRQLRLFQIAIGDVILDQLADAVMGDQEIAAPQKTQHRPPAYRKDVAPLQSAPHGGKPLHAIERGIAGIERTVQGADAGADHHIRGDAVGGERMQHSHLDGPEAAAARKHKGCLRRTDLVAYRHARTPSSPRRQQAARRMGVVIAAGERGGLHSRPSFQGDAKHRTRNLEIPRCAIAHLRSGPSDHPGMTARSSQRSTNAFSITKWPGVLWLPSRKPPDSNICLSSSSIPGLPHIMMRSVSILSGAWWMSLNNCSDEIRSVMRPRLRNGSRVTVGKKSRLPPKTRPNRPTSPALA